MFDRELLRDLAPILALLGLAVALLGWGIWQLVCHLFPIRPEIQSMAQTPEPQEGPRRAPGSRNAPSQVIADGPGQFSARAGKPPEAA